MTTWGLSATIKAPAAEILRFVAYHLGQGAHRLYIYLDDDNPTAFAACKAHPKIRVTHCDDAHWRTLNNGRRPVKHQVRQAFNATHAYNRPAEVDWLIHIDVDERMVSPSCTCNFFQQNKLFKGPCEHMLALRMAFSQQKRQ